jgi:hypothetical protein
MRVIAQAIVQLRTIGLRVDRLQVNRVDVSLFSRSIGFRRDVQPALALPSSGHAAQRAEIIQGVDIDVGRFGKNILGKSLCAELQSLGRKRRLNKYDCHPERSEGSCHGEILHCVQDDTAPNEACLQNENRAKVSRPSPCRTNNSWRETLTTAAFTPTTRTG